MGMFHRTRLFFNIDISSDPLRLREDVLWTFSESSEATAER